MFENIYVLTIEIVLLYLVFSYLLLGYLISTMKDLYTISITGVKVLQILTHDLTSLQDKYLRS